MPSVPPNATTPPMGQPPKPPTPSDTSSAQRNQLHKWESDEPLGDQATIAMILYVNQNHPNLKTEYPIWADRIKQIAKIWMNLPDDKRQPYVQAARENRTASRMNKQQRRYFTVPRRSPFKGVRPMKANPNLMAAFLKLRNQQQLQQGGAKNDILSMNEQLRLSIKSKQSAIEEAKRETEQLRRTYEYRYEQLQKAKNGLPRQG